MPFRRRKRAAAASGLRALASISLLLLLLTTSLSRVLVVSGDASSPVATTTGGDGIVGVKSAEPTSTISASAPSPSSPSPHSPSSSSSSSSHSSQRSSDTAAARAGAAHNTAATDALFFFAFMLLIGIFTVHVLAFTRVPYTALLLIWGVLLGVALETFASKWPLLPAGARLWEGIDPNLLLAGFVSRLFYSFLRSLSLSLSFIF